MTFLRAATTTTTRLTRTPIALTRTMSTSIEIPQKMRCVLVKDNQGPAENMYLGEEEVPKTKEGEVLVKIKAFGLNRMDIMQRQGKYPLPPQASKTIMGVEFAGEVVKLHGDSEESKEAGNESENGEKWKLGDEVVGLAYGGAYAEYIALSSKMIIHKPPHLTPVQAAGVPENWMTAYQALFLEGGMKEGENVLIHAGASGVGGAAIQLAIKFGANKVFTTAGTDDKVDYLKKLTGGKVHAFNYKTQDFEKEIKKVDEAGVDLIVDFVGPDYWNQNVSLLRQDGRMILLAAMSGPKLPADSALIPILFKRLNIKGSTLRSRSPAYQGDLLGRFEREALGALGGEDSGMEMKVPIYKVFSWKDVVGAHKEMEANKNSGKIVLEID
ncbi:hypothetical protein HD553DRAFT_92099 [Filobasidium floriforme]|uniref:uncharacterized protein n=1 Tax=Filobasidium floriforme TaxID=5210 RepID=UPI001E8E5BED|nr:uncharacterized protein HD553DRAFT_92099 [Filobasidium floriforme]KAH8089448.1 hypothetical protein HD553DRAFT_92099 [Filobasidium floriforme]